MPSGTNARDLPLHGLKVVDLGHFIAGPYCARLLADAGAEVIKVESLEGDEARRQGPFPDDLPDPDRSGLFLYLNTNKLGMTLDYRSPLGKILLKALLKDADVLVENNRPRDMEDLGLDFGSLHREFPHLIVTSITPFGQTGPYRDYYGDDLIAVNMGGMAYATPGFPDEVTEPEREPPLKPATYIADFTAAIAGAVATLLAVIVREPNGPGRHVDVSEMEAIASVMAWDMATSSYLGLIKGRESRLGYGPMPNGYFPCKDGYVVLTAFSEEHWMKLVEVMGDPDWADNELFRDSTARAENWDGLRFLLLEWTMAHTGREISELTQARGVPCFPAYEVSQAISSEQVTSRQVLRPLEICPGHEAKFPGLPFRLDDVSWPIRMPAPRLGQHTNSLVSERLGYQGPALAQLRGLGVI